MATTTTTVVKRGWGAMAGGGNPLIQAAQRQRATAAYKSYQRRAYKASTGVLPFQTQNRIYGRPTAGLQEVKSFDQQWVGGNLVGIAAPPVGAEPAAAFAGMTEINCVPQGATVANRIGNKIVIKSIHVRSALVALAGVQGEARLMLVYDKQPNGAFPAITDIITSQPLGAATAYSGVNIANKSRFQMIRDQFFNLDGAQSLVHSVNWYCKGRFDAEFGANAGNIGDFRTGSLLLVAFITYAAGGNIAFQAGSSRIRYFD